MTTLFGFECPDCEKYHKQVEAAICKGVIRIRCPTCGFLEEFVKGGEATV